MREGKLGCAECYSLFFEELQPSLQRIHGRIKHNGKISAGGGVEAQEQKSREKEKAQKLAALKSDMKKAIEEQDFERAATPRNRTTIIVRCCPTPHKLSVLQIGFGMMNKWYIEKGAEGDVALSTRIRLARNIADFPFPSKLDIKGKNENCSLLRGVLAGEGADDFKYIDMNCLTPSQAVSLAERHLISPEFTTNRDGRGLLLTDDESVSIMICEEDHIRLQVMKAGLSLDEAFETADKIDNRLDAALDYAFDDRIGYLTQCPTNLGTAMRASVMLHLPALTATGKISSIASTVSKLGLTIRGAYGEGTSARGCIYQMSNRITLGITERAALDNLRAITLQIAAQERAAQEVVLKRPAEEDKVFRAM